LERVLASYGWCLETASKDKENGIAIVRNLLKTENDMPGIYFFRDCVSTIKEVEDYMYDPETFKPSKKDDDFCECLYRLALLGTEYMEPFSLDVSKQRAMVL